MQTGGLVSLRLKTDKDERSAYASASQIDGVPTAQVDVHLLASGVRPQTATTVIGRGDI